MITTLFSVFPTLNPKIRKLNHNCHKAVIKFLQNFHKIVTKVSQNFVTNCHKVVRTLILEFYNKLNHKNKTYFIK